MTNGQRLAQAAERLGIPIRTLENVQGAIALCNKNGTDIEMARLMLRHGRLTVDAREWLTREYGAVQAA